MALSNLTAAFNESSDAAKSSISDIFPRDPDDEAFITAEEKPDSFHSDAEDKAFIIAEDRPNMDPGFEPKSRDDSTLIPVDTTDTGFDPDKGFIPKTPSQDSQLINQIFNPNLTQDEILEMIQRDVDFSYDENTNTFNITSGEVKPSTMDAVRAYFGMADGKYDEANIVVGEDVTFVTGLKPAVQALNGVGHYTEIAPSFSGIKCNSIDIQSQNIVNGDKMFAGAEADIIKIADQPNLKSADNMFNGCTSSAVVIGERPPVVQGNMFRGCEAVVLNSDLTDVIYDPEAQNDSHIIPGITSPHIVPGSGDKIAPINPKIEITPNGASVSGEKTIIETIRDKFDKIRESSMNFADKVQERAKQAIDALGLDDVSDPASVEKSDGFEK